MTDESEVHNGDDKQGKITIPVSREHMEKAIAAFPESKLNRSSSNASFLRIPQRDTRSDSDVSLSVVERLRELRAKFTSRTEIIKAKEIEKVEVSESESEEEKEEETGTDPTKSDEKEIQLGGEFSGTQMAEKQLPWWRRYPNHRLIIRQPLCLACLHPNRKYFISKPDLPFIRIQGSDVDDKQIGKDEVNTLSEQGNEQAEIIGQEYVQLKEISIPLPTWLVGLKDVFSATISPYSNVYLAWLGFLLIAVLYNYITIPFREAFNIYDDEDNTTLWYTLNSITDTLYLLDILLIRPRVEFLDGGIVKTDFKSCAMNYLKSVQFKIDITSIIPLDLFSFFYEKDMARFRILRLLKVIDILDSASANKVNYRKIMDATLSSMQHLHAPEHVVNKVRSWFMYNWDQQKTFDENSLFESLPIKLKSDLAISVHFHTLSKVSLFQNCERALIYDMILKLKPVVFLPMDYICRKGEVGKEMYIVKSGMVEVVGGPNNSIVFVTLKEGSVFGEISLLALSGKNRRTADVRSKGFSTLFSLSKQDFEEIMKNYPQAHELLKKRSQRMLNRDKKKAKDEAKKEEKKKKKMEKETSIEFKDDVAIEVIPERPATPKLVETVVKAIESAYPDKLITRHLKGSLLGESGIRRRSSYFITPKPNIGKVKSSNASDKEDEPSRTISEVSGPETKNPVEVETTIKEPQNQHTMNVTSSQNINAEVEENNHDDVFDDDNEDFDQIAAEETLAQEWIDLLTVDRNPIKRITSYFPRVC
ncbi:unnamed protein product [Heterobilharzia americana]|nr:unnamed protein product [Heterobilharzia americana]